MTKEKIVRSSVVLKNLKNMRFVERLIVVSTGEIRDFYFHDVAQITLRRDTHRYQRPDGTTAHYVHWTCEELGGGNGGLGSWLAMARERRRLRIAYGE